MEQPVNIRSLTHQLVQCLEIKPIREPWSKHLQTTWQLNHHPASGACKECDRRSLVSVQNDLKMPSIYESGSKSCPPRCVLYSFDPMLGPLWLLFETLTVRLGWVWHWSVKMQLKKVIMGETLKNSSGHQVSICFSIKNFSKLVELNQHIETNLIEIVWLIPWTLDSKLEPILVHGWSTNLPQSYPPQE